MSSNKRSHTTELGCIASEELTDLGAGKEGWLVENPKPLGTSRGYFMVYSLDGLFNSQTVGVSWAYIEIKSPRNQERYDE
ncbi:hypothetical protein OIU77_015847 [Salix suchowensis]|uniref:Uncharacterized protein n=1 Tax=Salix suchowensis TaxID=1278906 RepID=A0ABQ8ZIE7_9ROSI|nr:hypothetical protein OIU77_015847 [Salix suchowensis]